MTFLCALSWSEPGRPVRAAQVLFCSGWLVILAPTPMGAERIIARRLCLPPLQNRSLSTMTQAAMPLPETPPLTYLIGVDTGGILHRCRHY